MDFLESSNGLEPFHSTLCPRWYIPLKGPTLGLASAHLRATISTKVSVVNTFP